MALQTAGDLISFALKTAGISGVGQTPSAEDANDALVLLSSMVAGWQKKRWLVWDLVDTALVSTGAASYTVFPTGDFPIARPDRIDSAFVRFLNTTAPNQVDYPLAIIEAREDYNAIVLKTLSSWPLALWYESAWPTGVLHFWPIPVVGAYELHISTKAALPVFSSLTTALNLPPEYIEALIYSLAVRLSINYGQDPRPAVVGAMEQALNTIRMANTQVAELSMPPGLGRSRRGQGSADHNIGFLTGSW